VRPTFPWLRAALARPVRIARPETTSCLSSLDVDDLLPSWQLAMARNSPERISILAGSSSITGCPCYERFSFAGGDILPFFVRGVPSGGIFPPGVHEGAFTLTGYFTGRRINTYDWYAANGAPDAKPEEGANYESPALEFVVEGLCFHAPDPGPVRDELVAESNAVIRRLGVPFCKTKSPCFDSPKALPVGVCSRDLVSKKARLLNSRDLLAEWDAAKQRYLFGLCDDPRGVPTEYLWVETWHDADPVTLASRLGAKSVAPADGIPEFATIVMGEDSQPWRFRFDSLESAIDAVPRALCDPDIVSVRMMRRKCSEALSEPSALPSRTLCRQFGRP
jgi:hypothetical protein